VEWIRFLSFLFLDGINQSSLKLRPGMQDYQEFFRLRRGAFRPKAAFPDDPACPVKSFLFISPGLILSNYFFK